MYNLRSTTIIKRGLDLECKGNLLKFEELYQMTCGTLCCLVRIEAEHWCHFDATLNQRVKLTHRPPSI